MRNLRDGSLGAKFEPPPGLIGLSLRHLASDADGRVWFGGQWEGGDVQTPALVGSASLDGGIEFADIGEDVQASLRNYVGSVAANADGSHVAFTSPVDGSAIVIDAKTGKVVRLVSQRRVCGVAGNGEGFLLSRKKAALADAITRWHGTITYVRYPLE